MYDFYFGSREDIQANQAKYLIFVKRMLPRWVNSIPDSEYLAIHNALNTLDLEGRTPVIAETGIGASTIPLVNYVMKHNGVLFSWDINGSKGAFLRSVLTDTLAAHYGKSLFDHWKFIAYSSLSEQLGIDVLGELRVQVDFCFLDSEHTRDVLLGELTRLNPYLRNNAIVAIDDANYSYIHTNISYINMFRKKLGLPPAAAPANNTCAPFYQEVETYLRENWMSVDYLKDTYKLEYQRDIFWTYYSSDREVMGKQGMEHIDALDHRFDSWRVSGRLT